MRRIAYAFGVIFLCITSCREKGDQSLVVKDGVLDRSIYTENYIEKIITIGMERGEVEGLLGRSFSEDEFMETERSRYVLSQPNEAGLNLVGFSVVYKGGKVASVDKEWEGLGK